MKVRRLIAWVWTVVILVLCWTPRAHLPGKEVGPSPFGIPFFDKVVHFGIFAVFAFLWSRAASSSGKLARIAAWGVGLAILSELGQMVPIVKRDAGWLDGLADTAGVVAGIVFYAILPARRSDHPPSEGSGPVLSPSDGVGTPTRSSIDR